MGRILSRIGVPSVGALCLAETRRLEWLGKTQRVNMHHGGVEEAIRQVETGPICSQVQDNGKLECHFIH